MSKRGARKNREVGSDEITETRGFPSPSFNGFGFVEKERSVVRLPSGVSPREAKVKILETGPLHDFLRKGCE
jgi:hypothetical protein